MNGQTLLAICAALVCSSSLFPSGNAADILVAPGITTKLPDAPAPTSTGAANPATQAPTGQTVGTTILTVLVTETAIVNVTGSTTAASTVVSTPKSSESTEEPDEESTRSSTTEESTEEPADGTDEENTSTMPTSSEVPSNSSCVDLPLDCAVSQCSDPKRRFLCAKTCNSCDLRAPCENNYGDSFCWYVDFLCDALPGVSTVCKKSCGKCQAMPPPPPVDASNNCTDFASNCHQGMNCTADFNNIWCAKTCGTCQDLTQCQDAMAGDECQWVNERKSLCRSPSSGIYFSGSKPDGLTYYQIMCKKSCGAC